MHSETAVADLSQRKPTQALYCHMELSDGTPAMARDAFDRMVVEHHEPIRRLVYRLLGWRDEAEDVVQEVFLSAWAAWERVRDKESPDLWLKRIATNKCRSRLRREAVRRRWFSWLSATPPEEPRAMMEDSLAAAERGGRVREAIKSLGASYREVIVLHYLEQMSVEQIAVIVGAHRNTVEVRLHRARRQLEELLADLME
ncbi:MAG TPA: RNA polymerase sigma factor [Pirellulales bacterium]|jgi:RNA polymerase sigma-70 factor (ECF subfamily)|nr:RNA polymerase sigma factor [Pirellulales bacterium]